MNETTSISQQYASGDPTQVYVIKRIEEQIAYYEFQSKRNKTLYHRISIAMLVTNALIPIVSIFMPSADTIPKLIITVLSSITTILTGVLTLYGTKDLWTKYRSNANHLTAILHQYYAHTGPFAGKSQEDAFQLLSVLCETQLEDERKQWNQFMLGKESK